MDSKPTYNREEYERLTRELHTEQQKLLPRKTLGQHVADNWVAVVAILVVIVIPVLYGLMEGR
jgi:hypothetical protein